jgi:DNA-binding PadR family transcriptional regulator
VENQLGALKRIVEPPWPEVVKAAILQCAQKQDKTGIGFRDTFRALSGTPETRVGSFTTLARVLDDLLQKRYLIRMKTTGRYHISPQGLKYLERARISRAFTGAIKHELETATNSYIVLDVDEEGHIDSYSIYDKDQVLALLPVYPKDRERQASD